MPSVRGALAVAANVRRDGCDHAGAGRLQPFRDAVALDELIHHRFHGLRCRFIDYQTMTRESQSRRFLVASLPVLVLTALWPSVSSARCRGSALLSSRRTAAQLRTVPRGSRSIPYECDHLARPHAVVPDGSVMRRTFDLSPAKFGSPAYVSKTGDPLGDSTVWRSSRRAFVPIGSPCARPSAARRAATVYCAIRRPSCCRPPGGARSQQ